ncbi:hypothetical protein acdb102_41350 [Acidothermaceae bacterium B102]|nr:hypothetical protein acdb102_41350 [Acidothermaceae bacterium B102]
MSTIAELSDALLHAVLAGAPVDATLLGFHSYDRLLPDLSEAAEQARVELLNGLLAELDDAPTTSVDEVLEADILRAFVLGLLDHEAARTAEFTVSDYFGTTVGSLLTAAPMIGLTEPAHAEDYLHRLRAVPGLLAAAASRASAGSAAGRTAVAPLVQRAADQVDRYLADPDGDPFLAPAPPADWDGADAFAAERQRILADEVRPAMAAYRDAILADVLPHARPFDRPGLTWLPGGDESYAALVRLHTTTARTPAEIHQLGLDVIAGLAREYAEVGGRLYGTTEPTEIFRRIRTDPTLPYRDAAEILSLAESAVRRAEAAAPKWFGRLPQQQCVVKAVPDDQARQAPVAYYFPPALDGSRGGVYFANTSDPELRLRHESEAIAFHEAVPGHHFQLSLIQELSLSPLRKVYTVTAYTEGWGLYAERLAHEMGLYSDDVALLGMLSADSLRAARLVVDTGMHALGWSRDQAVAYCRDNTPMTPADIEVEIDRYISDPGQALAYMVGRLEIMRVRALAEQRLGAHFDIRGFHDAVLAVGGAPLGVLERVVATWCDTVTE